MGNHYVNLPYKEGTRTSRLGADYAMGIRAAKGLGSCQSLRGKGPLVGGQEVVEGGWEGVMVEVTS